MEKILFWAIFFSEIFWDIANSRIAESKGKEEINKCLLDRKSYQSSAMCSWSADQAFPVNILQTFSPSFSLKCCCTILNFELSSVKELMGNWKWKDEIIFCIHFSTIPSSFYWFSNLVPCVVWQDSRWIMFV